MDIPPLLNPDPLPRLELQIMAARNRQLLARAARDVRAETHATTVMHAALDAWVHIRRRRTGA